MPQQLQPIPFFQLRTVGLGYLKRAVWPRVVPQAPVIPTGFLGYTDYYCTAAGSNLNAGSDPNPTPVYTSLHGNWTNIGSIFTPTDGSIPANFLSTGMHASVFIDGATVGVYIGEIIGIGAGVNGTITMHASRVAGSNPVNQTGTATINVGGAFKGPNGASSFPNTLSGFYLNNKDAAGHPVRLNLKNDQIYSMTAALGFGQPCLMQGYSSSPGDGGKANIDGGASGVLISDVQAGGATFIDLIFSTSFASGSADLVTPSRNANFFRCVFTGARRIGLFFNATSCSAIECEAYACNKSNTANIGVFHCGSGIAYYLRCNAHDNGSGSYGFFAGAAQVQFDSCIAASNGSAGIALSMPSQNGTTVIRNCDCYNNASDGIIIAAGSVSQMWIENTNFVKNGGAGINNLSTVNIGFIYNCGYGSGSQSNRTPDILNSLTKVGAIIYPTDTTPWNSPTTGDFRITTPLALSGGRGAFTQTDGVNSGTIGYPDIGAAQHQDTGLQLGVSGDIVQPYGYVGHYYEAHETISPTSSITITIDSGSLPPGLALVIISPYEWTIRGTPTTVGAYTYVLKSVSISGAVGYITMHTAIFADPGAGAGGGGVGGG